MFRLDGSSEYRGQKLLDFLQERGIRLEPSVPYTLEQNGVSERSNYTIFKKLWSILYNTKALKNLWPEIIQGIIYVTNRSATAALESKTLYKALAEDIDRRLNPNATPISFEPSIEHLKVLGCCAIVHIQKQRCIVSEKAEP